MVEESETISAVAAASARRRNALLAADKTQLLAIMRHDLNYIHSNGAFDMHGSVIAKIGSGVVYKTIAESDLRNLAVGDDLVVRSGSMDIDVEIAGKASKVAIAFTEVWARGKEGWQLVSWQSTPRV